MTILKSKVQARITELQEQFERLSNDLNATLGAIQDSTYWLELADDSATDSATSSPESAEGKAHE